jgi:hypothetical protein
VFKKKRDEGRKREKGRNKQTKRLIGIIVSRCSDFKWHGKGLSQLWGKDKKP